MSTGEFIVYYRRAKETPLETHLCTTPYWDSYLVELLEENDEFEIEKIVPVNQEETHEE